MLDDNTPGEVVQVYNCKHPWGSTIGDMIQKLELTPDKAKEDKGEGISSREWRQRTRPSLETVTISHSGKSFLYPR